MNRYIFKTVVSASAACLLLSGLAGCTKKTGNANNNAVVGITQEPGIFDPHTVVAAGDEEIILNAADRARIGEALVKAVNAGGAKMKLSKETRDLIGGLILRRGSIETNCSVELLVELCRGELSAKLADVLFD